VVIDNVVVLAWADEAKDSIAAVAFPLLSVVADPFNESLMMGGESDQSDY